MIRLQCVGHGVVSVYASASIMVSTKYLVVELLLSVAARLTNAKRICSRINGRNIIDKLKFCVWSIEVIADIEMPGVAS